MHYCTSCGKQRRVLTLHTDNRQDLPFCSVKCLQDWALDVALSDFIEQERSQ